MLYSEIATVFEKLESTGSRLEMATILSDFFKTLNPADLRTVIYLSQGKLHPDFVDSEFGMADKLVVKAIALTSGVQECVAESIWIKEGDPGMAAQSLIEKKKQMALFSEPLTLKRVVDSLTQIESADGKDSQNKKMKILSNLLHDSNPIEARYLCRIVTGRMRVGASAMTILDALSECFADKSKKPEIERAFNVTCDLGYVAQILSEKGMEAINNIVPTVGSPIKVMLAERLPSLDEIMERMGGSCGLEYKYDGMRVQAHISKDNVKLFSRRLENLTDNFPDVCETLRTKLKGENAIIEGECVAVDENNNMMPFQTVTHRRRKHGMDSVVKDVPVKLFMFDILYYNGEDITKKSYPDRRALLSEVFNNDPMLELSKMEIVESVEDAENFFNDALKSKCEGVMAKSLSDASVYRAGSRGFLWIKYKKDYRQSLTDSFDLAVVGAFYGMGKRAGKYGALLLASYDTDKDMFCTVCKLGTGFDDVFLDSLPTLMERHLSDGCPKNVDAKMIPDVWFHPSVVLETVGAEISVSPIHTAAWGWMGKEAGIGIRFPRYTGRMREDKEAEMCTSVQEIYEMFEMQSR